MKVVESQCPGTQFSDLSCQPPPLHNLTMVSIRMGNIEINKQNGKLSHNNNNQTQMAHGGFIFMSIHFSEAVPKNSTP
jgi:hypothetical protein